MLSKVIELIDAVKLEPGSTAFGVGELLKQLPRKTRPTRNSSPRICR